MSNVIHNNMSFKMICVMGNMLTNQEMMTISNILKIKLQGLVHY